MDRRHVLRGASVLAGGVAVGGVGLAAPAMADDDGGSKRLTGTWFVTRQEDGGQATTTIFSLAAGGVAISHDISPAGPPITGTWKGKGRSFRATIWTGFPGGPPEAGIPGPTLRVQVEGRVSGDEISGTFEFTVFAPGSFETVADSGTGTFSGDRLEA